MVKGLKNAYLMHFPSLHSWFRCSVCFYLKCSSSHNQRVIQRVKKHFFVKKHKTADRKGGGVNPYGQPDRKISGFFLTASLMVRGVLAGIVSRGGADSCGTVGPFDKYNSHEE